MKHDKIILLALVGVGYYLYQRNQTTTADLIDSLQPVTDTIMKAIGGLTRGERNNNPGNIRHSGSPWQGLASDQSGDTAFATFESPEYGIRALAKLLQNYQAQGFNTVRAIINKYAPSSENNTSAYVNAVASAIGVNPDAAIDLHNADTLRALVAAIIYHENGRNIYADSGALDAGVGMVA